MLKKLILLLAFTLFFFPSEALAQTSSFVTIVNPVRGEDFWDSESQKPIDAVKGENEILRKNNLSATWLVRFDALKNSAIVNYLKTSIGTNELGLFLEVTPSWAEDANIKYKYSNNWHSAGSVFLTGYTQNDREKLIDSSFDTFKAIFGYYPKSVGAWWIDSYSLNYMQAKYNVSSGLIVADQFSTDNYQIWGQYFGMPYYPAKGNALFPAQTANSKIPVVMTQWAQRDPFNGFGKGVEESTYSFQANDYIDYHDLDNNYFKKLLEIYTKQPFNQVGQVTVGLENSYSWSKYSKEYQSQIEEIRKQVNAGLLKAVTMSDFANWYMKKFPNVSPEHVLVADDPLGSSGKAIWFMNPYYRIGLFYDQSGISFRDIRQYIDGQKEICFDKACDSLNFATTATRVLDDVTNKTRWTLDQGKIVNFDFNRNNDNFEIKYTNEAGINKEILLLPRDISVDGNIKSIDTVILEAVKNSTQDLQRYQTYRVDQVKNLRENLGGLILSITKYLLFLLIVILIPGFLTAKMINRSLSFVLFISFASGIVLFTLVSYIFSYINFYWGVYFYIFISSVLFFSKYKDNFSILKVKSFDFIAMIIIFFGAIFQSLPLIRSGWVYDFGVGFWGPLGHDGIWHQALIGQLISKVPPDNPIYSGSTLVNYHYFYDLFLAATYRVAQINILDLMYRFTPILFSILLGLGTYLLAQILFKSKKTSYICLYLVYFAGSFGWIVEYLREKHIGGESAFWMNQPVSFNLNPPFAISLVLVIAVLLLLRSYLQKNSYTNALLIILIAGTLIEFKVYAGLLVLLSLGFTSLVQLLVSRNLSLFKTLIGSGLLTLAVFLPQNSKSSELLVFSPFWFVHSMVEFSDRVGWQRLSQARAAYFERGEWLKYFLAEALAFAIFVLGNLGTRFIGLLSIITFVKRKMYQDYFYLFLFSITFLSLVIPTLFIQKGNPWNTIQFGYYFLYFLAILAAGVYGYLIKKVKLFFPLFLLLILITPINAIVTFRSSFYPTPPSSLPLGEYEGLNHLRSQEKGVVLTVPFNKDLRASFISPYPLFAYDTSSYVSAFSWKTSYIEDESQQEILQTDFSKRLVAANNFFEGKDKDWSKKFLKDNDIKYIYIPKVYQISLDTDQLNLSSLYDNNEVIILKVNQ